MTWLNKKFYVYTLFSLKDKKLYTGFTIDLKKDLKNMLKDYQKQQNLVVLFYLYIMNTLLIKLMLKRVKNFLKVDMGENNLIKS